MLTEKKKLIVIAHYGLDRKITEEECRAVLKDVSEFEFVFVDFESGNSPLGDLYSLPFENVALMQQRRFNEILRPLLTDNPDAHIAYFGLTPIPVGFHLGVLVGNLHPYTIYQWHHTEHVWYKEIGPPSADYKFKLNMSNLPQEIQRGKGDVTIRISTSFSIDTQSTDLVAPNPANDFDIYLSKPNVDSLHTQATITETVSAFQQVIDCYSNKLKDREKIHLFIASSAGLPFALGTRINSNVCPFIQTYQYDRSKTPKYIEAIFISKESESRPILTEENRKDAGGVRSAWFDQLENKLKAFITAISSNGGTWLETICDKDQYEKISKNLKHTWNGVPSIKETSLKEDKIELDIRDVEDGFEYTEKTNAWSLDDGFLFGLKKRLEKNSNTSVLQAGRLFFFHEALHYSKNGHSLTKEVATGIGQFPKVIEEADYQADVWALLTEYKYTKIYESEKLKDGDKNFFCNAIETAVETMWSFVDNGSTLDSFQIRTMNRFLNWYWQWLKIENLDGKGSLEEIICILFDKPVIEFAGAPMDLKAHRTYYKLNMKDTSALQLAAFEGNKVYRFAAIGIADIVNGFKTFNGEKIKSGLKSFQLQLPTTHK